MNFSALIPAGALACLAISLGAGLWVQEASNPVMMLPAALFGIWLAASGRLMQVPLRDPVLLLLTVLWACWAISAVHSPFPFNSEVTLMIMATLPLSYLVWRTAEFSERQHHFISGAALLCGAALGAGALVQAIAFPPPHWGGRAGYPFADPNMLGIFFALLAIPAGTALLTETLAPRVRMALGACLVLLLAGLLATQSRSALLGVMAGAILCAILIRRRIVWSRKMKTAVAMSAVLVAAGLAMSGLGGRMMELAQGTGEANVLGRLTIWRSALAMSLEHPFSGFGFGTFGLVYPLFRQPEDNSAGWWVHMDPLQWAVESGWQAAFVFYGLCLVIAVKIFRQARAGSLTPLQAGFAGSLLCLFINAHTAYPLHVVPFMLIGTYMIAQCFPFPAGADAKRLTAAFAALLLVTLLLNLMTMQRLAVTLYDWQSLSQARRDGDAYEYERALGRCLERGDPRYPFCKFMVIETALNAGDAPGDDLLSLIADARAAQPLLPQPDYYLGIYYLRTARDRPEQAIAAFRASLAKDPTFFGARRLLVTTLVSGGRRDEALAELEKAASYRVTRADRDFYDYMIKDLKPETSP